MLIKSERLGKSAFTVAILAAAMLLAACDDGADRFTGYMEGDYALPAPIASGRLVDLKVARGDHVKQGALLFLLDDGRETAARDQAAADLQQANANLSNLMVGKRPQEIDEIRAQKRQADARLALARISLKRQRELAKAGVNSRQNLDDAVAEEKTAAALVRQLVATLTVAALPARKQEIIAAEARVTLAEAMLREAEWHLDQRHVTAGRAARVEDSYFREGEFVPAGTPVLSLLPDGNIFVKFFVPQAVVPRLALGQTVDLRCDGCRDAVPAKVRFIARAAEYTPPVIYSENSRDKLMFRIEAVPERLDGLHPGLPVDVIIKADKS